MGLDDVYSSGFHTAQFPVKRSSLPDPEFLNGKESPSSTVVMGYDVHSTSPMLSEEARNHEASEESHRLYTEI
ncbi:hypothetical protein DPX16_14388 [Anabarilius grahami]|uniref:Uncharacterized protein n=1 Tax=Anabarilius grahami TaxID=495550 RepID=A0A3N0XM05_ANAGA|nr:hypothetical protein DPX16_14388 [Anabarilius grahami]